MSEEDRTGRDRSASGVAPHQLHGAALTCPVCSEPLQATRRTLRCGRGHAYDVAREGYVDLLPPGHGRSRRQGDTADMIRARARFLGRGHYEPLRQAVLAAGTAAVAGRVTHGKPAVILDAGCATGYYIGAFALAAANLDDGPQLHLLGADVSKHAVRSAARQHRDVLFFINDIAHRLCVPDASVDVLLDIFAPRNAAEFARAVRPGGLLVVVVPTPDHHHELRERLPLLGIAADKEERVGEALADAFALESRDVLRYAVHLSPHDVTDLVAMTPSAWHVDAAHLAAARDGDDVRTTLGFVLLRFRRRPVAPPQP